MKNKNLFTIIFLSIVLASCAPVPTNISVPTTVVTSASIITVQTHEPTVIAPQLAIPTSTPVTSENASKDCFLKNGFVSQETGVDEVLSAWGDPSWKMSLGKDSEYWSYDLVGNPHVIFKKQKVDSVQFFLKNCTLGTIVSKLGQPEKVEITVFVSDIDLSARYSQKFHYTSLGFSYFRLCDKTQDCFVFQSSDIVSGKEFYSLDKIIEDSKGFNMAGYVYNWHGFDTDVEEIENKIMDFVPTPTP